MQRLAGTKPVIWDVGCPDALLAHSALTRTARVCANTGSGSAGTCANTRSGTAPSSAQARVPAQEAGLAETANQVNPEIAEIKRSLSAQLEAAGVSQEVHQESAPQFGRGASVFGHAASFTETSGAAMLLKAWGPRIPYTLLLRSWDLRVRVALNSSLQTFGPVESSAAAVARPPPTFAPRKGKAAKEDTWAKGN